jgi:hypothetical protein
VTTQVCLSAPATGDPQPKDLIALAKKLETGAVGIHSIELTMMQGRGGEGVVATARVGESGPVRLALSDPKDGTPLLICAGDHALIYDLVGGCAECFDSAHFELLIYNADDRVHASYGLTQGPNHILLDLPSILAHGADQPSASHDGNLWTLNGFTRRGGLVVAHINLGEDFPYSSVRLYVKGDSEPVMTVGPIDVNKPPKIAFPNMPNEATVAAKLRVVHVEKAAANVPAAEKEVATAMRTFMYRAALREPTIRADIERQYGSQIDWSVLADRDKYMSAELRELAGGQPHASAPTTQPAER